MRWLTHRLIAGLHKLHTFAQLHHTPKPRLRWQHTTHAFGSSRTRIRAMLAETVEPLCGPVDAHNIDAVVVRYTECLRTIAAVDAAGGPGSDQDDVEVREIGTMLVHISQKIGRAVARYISQDPDRGPRILMRVVNTDCAYDPGHVLSSCVVRELAQVLDTHATDRVFTALYPTVSGRFDQLAPSFLCAVFILLWKKQCFAEQEIWERCLTRRCVDADVAFAVLCAIREQQKAGLGRMRTTLKQRRRVWSADKSNVDVFVVRARRVVWMLGQRDIRAVNDGHLTQLLAIELHAVPLTHWLPHPDVWLKRFYRHNVEPTRRTYAILVHAYIRQGDFQTAERLVRQAGSWSDHTLKKDVRSDHTLETAMAKMRATQAPIRDLFDVLTDARALHGSVLPHLLTFAVSRAIDARDMQTAEQLWIGFGCACATKKTNIRALAKLILGYAQSGHVEKATAFFHTLAACPDAEARTCVTGVFNAVLRCSISSNSRSNDGMLVDDRLRPDLRLLDMARKLNVVFDVTTYNVLLAQLSRAASHCTLHELQLPALARTAHTLYTHMTHSNIHADDTTICHVLPVCVYLQNTKHAMVLWQSCVRARPRHTVDQLRRHVLVQANAWSVFENTVVVIDSV
ncbi:hypothetical protein GGH12_001462 [Coemansia sp. RSA 1822]|nr:hypothetical protein GGH12_001462 [Coemansia sp. RSA 1822]